MWVPPNLKFELDDCTKPWTWPENTFDFIHMRYLAGAIADWDALLKEAYRTCQPGGWVQSCEADAAYRSDDGSLSDDSAFGSGLSRLFLEGGKKLGRSFQVVSEDLQKKGMEAAGFTDIHVADYKVSFTPLSGGKEIWVGGGVANGVADVVTCRSLSAHGRATPSSARSASTPSWPCTTI